MANTETTRQAARAALEAYKASPGMMDDDETAIIDLIADLAFLAEAEVDISGEYVITQGAHHFVEDKREQEDDDEEDDYPIGEEPGGALPFEPNAPQLSDGYGHSIIAL